MAEQVSSRTGPPEELAMDLVPDTSFYAACPKGSDIAGIETVLFGTLRQILLD
jgi:hypothetical protein